VTDRRRTTPLGVPITRPSTPARRHQTADERDAQSYAARREREAAVQTFASDEVTGQHTGEELRVARSHRPTGERLERLEDKHDGLVGSVTRIEVSVAEMRGELKILPDLVDALKGAASASSQRETITVTTKAEVSKAGALDSIEARKWTREQIGKVIAGLIGSSALTAAIVGLASRC
jgi:hypothetical protein